MISHSILLIINSFAKILHGCGFGNDVLQHVLNPLELKDLKDAIVSLDKENNVTKYLQLDDTDLHKTRVLFDALIAEFPRFAEYLGNNATIIHTPLFEKAVSLKCKEVMNVI